MIAFAHRVLMLACLVASVAITGCAGVTPTMAQQNPLHDPLEDQTGQHLYESGMRIAGQGDYIRAEQYFTAARDHGFPEERVLPMLMQVCIHSARYSAALGYAEPYLETHPENWGLRMLMATIQMGLGNAAAARLSLEHVVAEELAFAGGIDPTGMNDIHPNMMFGQFDRRRTGHMIDGRFRHVVGHRRRDRNHRVRRTDDDDRTARFLLDHLQRRGTKSGPATWWPFCSFSPSYTGVDRNLPLK